MTVSDAHLPIALAVMPLAGYLIGSTPFSVMIARSHGVDLRKAGSGNLGATNVGRVIGRKWGYLCFVLDVAKGFAPAFAAVALAPATADGPPEPLRQAVWLAAGVGAILGHVFSFWLGFKGGKGVATSLGVVLGIYPYFTWPALAAFAIWLAVVRIWRYVSLASIVAAAAFVPLFVAMHWPANGLWPMGAFAAAMCVLIIVRHRANIRRLLAGEENKVSVGKRT